MKILSSYYRGDGKEGGREETEISLVCFVRSRKARGGLGAREEMYIAMTICHALADGRKPKDEKNTTYFVNFKSFGFIFCTNMSVAQMTVTETIANSRAYLGLLDCLYREP